MCFTYRGSYVMQMKIITTNNLFNIGYLKNNSKSYSTSFFSDISLLLWFPRTLAHSEQELLTSLVLAVTLSLPNAATGELLLLNRVETLPLNMYPESMSGESQRGALTLDNVANIILTKLASSTYVS